MTNARISKHQRLRPLGQQWKYWVICEQFGSSGAMAYCIVEGSGLGA